MFSSGKVIFFKEVIFLVLPSLLSYHLVFKDLKNFQPSIIRLLCFIFFLSILACFSLIGNEHLAFAHFFGGGNNTPLNGTQNQTAGNFVVELLLNPSKPMVGKDTAFLTEVKSTQGDELIELPVSFYILKNGKPVFSNPNNFTLVRQGHYDFNYNFSEPGKYMLYVAIKDIFYTLDIVNLVFEIDVGAPVPERILSLLKAFLMNYYYLIILLGAVFGLSFIARWQRSKDVKKRGNNSRIN